MKTNIATIILAFISIVSSFSCNPAPQDKADSVTVIATGSENLNISILLDLSDRISQKKHPNPAMEYYKRDLGYIRSIALGFENNLRSKPVRQVHDQIQIFFEPEPLNSEINTLANKLKLAFTKTSTTKESIQKISLQYVSASTEIYNLAVKEQNYIGSDIWGFFKNKVNDYCIKPNHRNILFILTDGYMFHEDSKFLEGPKSSYLTPELIKALKLNKSNYKALLTSNKYGFIKANSDLHDLEVVVLGINPAKGNPYERDVIETYWSDWLREMKVKNHIIKAADLPSNLDPVIQKFIANK